MGMDKEHFLKGTRMKERMARYTHICYPLFSIYCILSIKLYIIFLLKEVGGIIVSSFTDKRN